MIIISHLHVSRIDRNTDGFNSSRHIAGHQESSRDITDQNFEKINNIYSSKTSGKSEEKTKEQPPVLKYIKTQVRYRTEIKLMKTLES